MALEAFEVDLHSLFQLNDDRVPAGAAVANARYLAGRFDDAFRKQEPRRELCIIARRPHGYRDSPVRAPGRPNAYLQRFLDGELIGELTLAFACFDPANRRLDNCPCGFHD